jgi:3-hydroxybutyryl-CoA dehydrogenase
MGLTGKRMAEEAGAGIAAGSVVGVVGAGVMGTGIAQVAALAGHAVRLYNHRPGKADKAVADIGRALARLVEKGRLDAAAAGAARARIEVAGSLQALAGAAFVIESVIEDLDVKRSVFTALEDIVDAGCILATNTSSLSVTAIGGVLARPQRLVGLHFFNPAPLMALVEVVRGLATDPQVAATAYATVAAWGKQPVHAASTPGFIVNRVARPYYGEALRLLTEGAGDAATIDAVLRECGGFRMGPFELMDLVGTDINLAVTQAVFDGFFNDPRYAPSLVQREMVSAGFLGRKTGRGYYRYGDDAVQPAPRTEPHAPAPAGACIAPAYEALRARLQAAGIACTVADAGGPACLHIGGAQVWLTDGRHAARFRRRPPRHHPVRPAGRSRYRAARCAGPRRWLRGRPVARRRRPVPGGRLRRHADRRRAGHGRDAGRGDAGQRGGRRRQRRRVQRVRRRRGDAPGRELSARAAGVGGRDRAGARAHRADAPGRNLWRRPLPHLAAAAAPAVRQPAATALPRIHAFPGETP